MNWMRTCQSCGCKNQHCPPPDTSKELTKAFEERKCKWCKSADLDYGQDLDLQPEEDE